jgi:hypothetical protein
MQVGYTHEGSRRKYPQNASNDRITNIHLHSLPKLSSLTTTPAIPSRFRSSYLGHVWIHRIDRNQDTASEIRVPLKSVILLFGPVQLSVEAVSLRPAASE